MGSTPSAGTFFTVIFLSSTADVWFPPGRSFGESLQSVTHLGIGAHQDDLEFMAFHGICECHGRTDQRFGGVVCTSGAGSARQGRFAQVSDAEMASVRQAEQIAAAQAGDYAVMLQLGFTSAEVRDRDDVRLREDLVSILSGSHPGVIYTHNLADKHPTHLGVVRAVIEACRALPREMRPQRLIGCEGWRDLDWMPDDEKVLMDVSGHGALFANLASCFASQIEGGKRYDLAVAGRRAAQATFFNPHAVDNSTSLIYGMDLTPLLLDDSLDPADILDGLLAKFCEQVRGAWRGSA